MGASLVTGAISELRVRLFGHVALEIDGKPFHLATPRKTLPILAYLLLHRGQPIARDFLAYLMWPDDAEESARTKLRASLHALARILPVAGPNHWLVVDVDGVRWNADAPVWLDVEEFESLARDPERLDDAVLLYRGDLLATVYDEWVFTERERYRNLYLASLTQLVSSARRRRDFPQAIARAQQLLATDAWREDIVQRLIAIRYESGDRAGALAEFRRFAQQLHDELQIDPMPETLALRDAIARDAAIEAEPPSAGSVAPERLAPAQALPFAGRRAEMEQLLDAWGRAARGRGSCVFIGGPPGIGKSRLGLEFAHAVEERGGRALAGATGSPEAIPYQCVVEALRSALPLVASLRIGDVWLATLATLLPELHGRLAALPALPRVDAASERPRLFESLVRCLAALAQPRPLMLLLEDLHWADEATTAALGFLLRRIALLPVLVVVTYRDDETPRGHPLQRLQQEARAEGSARGVWLRPLTLIEVQELSGALDAAGGHSAVALHAASEGNPLFLTQLIDGARDDLATTSPKSLRTLVSGRIDRLSPDTRTIAEIAALIGTRFSRDATRHVSGWDEGAVDDALDELIDRRIVRETSGRGFFDYEFVHHVVAEVIAGAAPPERSSRRHRRVARVLQELYPDRGDELAGAIARHYDLAGDAEAAAPRYLRAARRDIALGALDEAASGLARGLELASNRRLQAELVLERQTLAARRADDAASAADLVTLEGLSAELDDAELLRTVAHRRVALARERADREGEAKAIAALRTLLTGTRDARWIGALNDAQAQYDLVCGRFEDAHVAATAALAAYLEANDREGEAEVRYRLVSIEVDSGRLGTAEILLDEARRAAERTADGRLKSQSIQIAFKYASYQQDLPRLLELGQAWLETGLALGDRRVEAFGHSRFGMALNTVGGRHAEARRHFHEADEIFREIGDKTGAASTVHNRALLEIQLGNFSAAGTFLQHSRALFAAVGDQRGETFALSNLALVEAYAGDFARAKAHAHEAIAMARSLNFWTMEMSSFDNLAFAEGAAGEFAAAIEHMEHSIEVRSKAELYGWTANSLADLAVWHLALGDIETARVRIARMLEAEETIAIASWPQSCYWAAARVFRACGEHQACSRALERAHGIVRKVAADLDDDDRERYLAIPWNREIVAAAEQGVWPDPPA